MKKLEVPTRRSYVYASVALAPANAPLSSKAGWSTLRSTSEGMTVSCQTPNSDPRTSSDWLFCAYRDCQRMVRDKRWKLIGYNAAGVRNTQVFDLSVDSEERRNLAHEEKFVGERRRLERSQQQPHELGGVGVERVGHRIGGVERELGTRRR